MVTETGVAMRPGHAGAAGRGAKSASLPKHGAADRGHASVRPVEVPGPAGRPLTLASLPPPDTRRWVVRRKAEVLAAIRGGLLSEAEACSRYRLSPEELELWRESLERDGIPGLRVTRIQLYRDYPVHKPARSTRAMKLPVRDLAREWGV